MNGPQHYAEGERLLTRVHERVLAVDEVLAEAALAQAHFLAAQVAVTFSTAVAAQKYAMPGGSAEAERWMEVLK